jgi:hypothetical protein
LIRALRPFALLVAGATLAASCTTGSGNAGSARPADLYAVMPTQAGVRSLMGDGSWWGGPPTFEVSPLNWSRTPQTEKFAVSETYVHLGSDERLFARYVVYDKTSSASSEMSSLQSFYGNALTSPKVGDQVLYVVQVGSGGAPYEFFTYVRVGQVVLTVVLSRRDTNTTASALSRIAKTFSDPIKNLGKTHAPASQVDPNLLPPPGLDITMLGSANLPLESYVVLQGSALPDTVLALLNQGGASTFAYGDYALNNDPNMEVQTGIIHFPDATTAMDWANTISPNPPDQSGIGSGYIKTGNTPAAGIYHYVFASNDYVALIVCKSAADGEAASRECEDPAERTAIAWKAGLEGLR